jgi:hypothetical protein
LRENPDMPEDLIRITYIEGSKEKISSTAKVFVSFGDSLTANICENVERLSARIGTGVIVRTSACIDSDGRYNRKVIYRGKK